MKAKINEHLREHSEYGDSKMTMGISAQHFLELAWGLSTVLKQALKTDFFFFKKQDLKTLKTMRDYGI